MSLWDHRHNDVQREWREKDVQDRWHYDAQWEIKRMCVWDQWTVMLNDKMEEKNVSCLSHYDAQCDEEKYMRKIADIVVMGTA